MEFLTHKILKMIRTTYKDGDYFNEYIKFNLESIEEFDNEIKVSTDDAAKERRLNIKNFLYAYQSLIAMYSRGDSIQDIKSFFPLVVEKFEKGTYDVGKTPMDKYNFDSYFEILWMLSWCILLDVAPELSVRVIKVVQKMSRHDFFIDLFLSHLTKQNFQSDAIFYPDPYEKLRRIVKDDTHKTTQNLLSFLEKDYYKGMKLAYWYDAHKNKNDVYFGYWCFEVAAICKVLNVNDEILKSSEYYPYEMKHYAK